MRLGFALSLLLFIVFVGTMIIIWFLVSALYYDRNMHLVPKQLYEIGNKRYLCPSDVT